MARTSFFAIAVICFWIICLFPVSNASHVIYNVELNTWGEYNTVSPTVQQRYRTAYHFQPPKNWMNDPNGWDNSSRQVQNMAVPKNASDPYLREWIKIPQNPIMVPLPENGINVSSFRDPTTAWLGKDGRWRLIVGNKEDRHHKGRASFTPAKISFAGPKSSTPSILLRRLECGSALTFTPVSHRGELGLDTSVTGPGLKHVLKVSLDDTRFEYYTIGTYFPDLDRYVPDNTSVDNKNGLRYDYGKFYASKTFFDNYKTRRILWGWINESDSTQDDVDKGWSGVQAMPRSIWLDNVAKSQLIQWPVSELESLRGNKIYKEDIILMGGSTIEISGLTAAQADVEVSFNLPSLTDVERWIQI